MNPGLRRSSFYKIWIALLLPAIIIGLGFRLTTIRFLHFNADISTDLNFDVVKGKFPTRISNTLIENQ